MEVRIKVLDDSYNTTLPEDLRLIFKFDQEFTKITVRLSDSDRILLLHKGELAKLLTLLE